MNYLITAHIVMVIDSGVYPFSIKDSRLRNGDKNNIFCQSAPCQSGLAFSL
jgi:hypothetical protein